MRVLIRVYSPVELDRITHLMRTKGIPTVAEAALFKGALRQWIVFVCLNSQLDDARKLLANPEHHPANPIDVDEFDRAAATTTLPTILRWSFSMLVLVAALFAVVLYYYYAKHGV